VLYKAKKGQVSYGEAIGILLLDTSFSASIPGSVTNATTYTFPVRFKVVKGLTVERMFNGETRTLDLIIEAGNELVENGVRAITSNCGFMAVFQREVSKQFEVPVFLSSLLQLSFLTRIIGEGQKVGIITTRSKLCDATLLREVGINDMNSVYIKGLQDKENFRKAVTEQCGCLDSEKVEKEVVSTAKEMVKEEPRIKVILLECAALPPYGAAVQEVLNLPVFDFATMINYVYSAVIKKRFEGFM